ncbi:unnamed protein product [Brassica napus]|uniref:(rape) hypothetical protein n=1 Tax=Brassica napus TaxID=3708 RepID=A0A816I8T9_BRANA|nr:unnamed protein product [Brassica napus]
MYFFATPILKYLGQPGDIGKHTGTTVAWVIPIRFAFAFVFPLNHSLPAQEHGIYVTCFSLIQFSFR